MRRGDLVTVSMQGDFGKPRPALIIQADQFDLTFNVTVLLLSGTLIDAPLVRVTVAPNAENGLRKISQVMIDKTMTVRREKVGPTFGSLDGDTMLSISSLLGCGDNLTI
ncbi:type II toxin-antitoxin system PemK/MazF family toxin [Rhizobium metallidurans]|uniref:mRNA interferase MazF n=1 Tax=Rhizobium metallidurans TaxID=1265931 RepID=A0A7W6CSY0_9HYPH|nr:type II toxin-antitoxin system PemK/MazF family toxin [Rhizobium metallidurans]MBB3964593.1 mRNA interferase MazF [Rhizobium metallidurans]